MSFRADDDEVDVALPRVGGDQFAVLRVERDRLDLRGDSGVAGGGDDFVIRVFANQSCDDRVLAGARTEDQDSHLARLPGAREAPEPVQRTVSSRGRLLAWRHGEGEDRGDRGRGIHPQGDAGRG